MRRASRGSTGRRGGGAEEHDDEEHLVAGPGLDVAAHHPGQRHAQAEADAGRERVVRRLVRPGRDLVHHVDHVPDRADAPAELLDRLETLKAQEARGSFRILRDWFPSGTARGKM